MGLILQQIRIYFYYRWMLVLVLNAAWITETPRQEHLKNSRDIVMGRAVAQQIERAYSKYSIAASSCVSISFSKSVAS